MHPLLVKQARIGEGRMVPELAVAFLPTDFNFLFHVLGNIFPFFFKVFLFFPLMRMPSLI